MVVDSYRRALDDLAKGHRKPMDTREREWLMQAFHRGGFTRGHAGGDQDAALACPDRVGHGGLPVGQVLECRGNLARIKLERPLEDGDSLQLRGSEDISLRYSGQDRQAGEEATLRLRPGVTARPGEAVYRLTQEAQMAWVRALCQDKPLAVRMRAVLAAGQAMILTLTADNESFTVKGDVVFPALNRSMTRQEARRQLSKLGGSPFVLEKEEDLELEMADDVFVPVSSLNALRRTGLEALAQARRKAFFGEDKEAWLAARDQAAVAGPWAAPAACSPPSPQVPPPPPLGWAPPFTSVTLPWPPAFKSAGASLLLFEPWDWRPQALEPALASLPRGTWLALSTFLSEAALQDILL